MLKVRAKLLWHKFTRAVKQELGPIEPEPAVGTVGNEPPKFRTTAKLLRGAVEASSKAARDYRETGTLPTVTGTTKPKRNKPSTKVTMAKRRSTHVKGATGSKKAKG